MKVEDTLKDNSLMNVLEVFSNADIEDSVKMNTLAETLRIIAKDEFITNKEVAIPSECEKYGFVQGEYNLAQMLQFLADMLEE